MIACLPPDCQLDGEYVLQYMIKDDEAYDKSKEHQQYNKNDIMYVCIIHYTEKHPYAMAKY